MAIAQDDRLRLKHASIASLVFFIAYGMIYHANANLPDSLKQELTAFVALLLCGLSLFWVAFLQLIYILKNMGVIKTNISK